MPICVLSPRAETVNPTSSSDEIRGLFLSPRGNFAASVSDSILTVFDLKSPAMAIVGCLDVSEIVDAGGARFKETEGTFSHVCWDPEEKHIYASTRDSLLGVIKLEHHLARASSRAEIPIDDPSSLDKAMVETEKSNFSMKLDTVLLVPVPETVLVGAQDCLVVAACNKRALFLIDWNNYQSRARRFVYPSALASCEEPGSPCVNSVLPSLVEAEVSDLPLESDRVITAALSGSNQTTLLLGYESGIVRSFAFSTPSDPMCGLLPAEQVVVFSVENELVAFVSKKDLSRVIIYRIANPVTFTFMREFTVPFKITSLAWSQEFLSVGHESGILIYNRHQSSFVLTVSLDSCMSLVFSLSTRLIISMRHRSPFIDITRLGVSADAISRCNSSQSSMLMLGRDCLRLLTPPSRQWRFIPCPHVYMQENGIVVQGAVQQNHSSRFVIISGKKGFALWSSYSSTSAAKREGRWEVVPDKSQEARIGQIEIFGFLSETVFFTKSVESNEVVLWSVLKRLDLSFALLSIKLHQGNVDHAAVDSTKGILALVFLKLQRIDIYRLRTDSANDNYSLELFTTLPCDFPLPLRALILIPSGARTCSVLGLSKSNEVFLRTGERICGNVDSVHACRRFGVERELRRIKLTTPLVDTTAPSTPSITGIQTPATESAETSEIETDYETDQCVPADQNGAETFFIGDSSCKFCDRLKRVPKVKNRIVSLIHKESEIVFFVDSLGSVSVWLVGAGRDYAARLEYATRFSSELNFTEGVQILNVCEEWGVMSTVNGTDMRISHTSCVHPLLAIASPGDAHAICNRLHFSPFFSSIIEMWLHQELNNALPILAGVKTPLSVSCLTAENPDLCGHALSRSVLNRLLHAMYVSSHFSDVFPSVFAAAVRKSEPHITFPLTTVGAFTGVPASELFRSSVHKGRLREAALLLVVIQEESGPVTVREQFAIPLFREALIVQEYGLAREIAHFHFSFSKKRTISWSPLSGASIDDLSEEILLMTIDTVVISHFNYLVNESLDWFRLVRFSERLRLVIGDWLSVVPKQEYLDISQLVGSFRSMLDTLQMFGGKTEVLDVLVQGFKKAKWMTHWKAIVVAAESLEGLRGWFSIMPPDASMDPADDTQLQKYMAQYI